MSLQVVGQCPKCGAPIYVQEPYTYSSVISEPRYNCMCRMEKPTPCPACAAKDERIRKLEEFAVYAAHLGHLEGRVYSLGGEKANPAAEYDRLETLVRRKLESLKQ